mgnify:CR=1 FL=1
MLAVSCGSKTQRAAGSKTLSTLVLCAAAAAGLSQMGGRGAYYKAKYGGGRGRAGGRKGGRERLFHISEGVTGDSVDAVRARHATPHNR